MASIRELFSPRDMTEGAPWKRILEFAVPMLIGNVAQQLYNTADSIIVGRYVGDNALAAVGNAGPIINLLLALFVGIATGAGILVSQAFGAKDRARLSEVIGTCITLTFLASLVVMGLGLLTTNPLLLLLDTPESIFAWSADYLNIIYIGAIGFFFYNILSGVLRGLGDSLSALVFLIAAAGMNIVLDLWFVAGLGMGVAGAAWATIISQAISAVLCLLKMLRMKAVFDLITKLLRPKKKLVGEIFKLGIPSGLTQAIFSTAMLVVQALVNSFGETVIACNVIVMRVDGFAMMPNFSFGMAMTTFAAQNVGARRLDRIHKGTRQGTLMAVGIATALTLIILLFGKNLMAIFTDTTSLVDLSYQFMTILAAGYIAMAVTQCLSGVMRGAGDTVSPMWISLVTTIVIRVPLAYLLAYLTRTEEYPKGQFICLPISLLASWVMGAVINFIVFRVGGWRKKCLARIKAEDEAKAIASAEAVDDAGNMDAPLPQA